MAVTHDAEAPVLAAASRARTAARVLAQASRATKDAALQEMAQGLLPATSVVLAANARDVSEAKSGGTAGALVDRLRLDEARVAGKAPGRHEGGAPPHPR